VLELDDEVNVETERDGQKHCAEDGEGADAAAGRAQIFDQLLLFEGVTVGGFANALQLIFDPFKVGDLLKNLAAQFAIAVANLGQAVLDWLEVDVYLLRRRCGMRLGGHQGADCGRDVAIDQRQQLLHKGKARAESVEGTMEAGSGCASAFGRDRLAIGGCCLRWHGGG